jgi:signal transduction histidine kinase
VADLGAARRRWWRRISLRARLTVAATAVLAVGLTAGGLLLVGTVSGASLRALDAGALRSARGVAALVDAGRLSDPIPVGGPTRLVQVVDSAGRVRAASAGADRLVPLLAPGDLADARPRFLPERRTGPYGAPLRVVAVPAGPPGDRQTVIVAVGVGEVLDSLRVVRTAVLVGFPLLLAALAALSWLVIGGALRPVEALRAGAEEITGTRTGDRLPVTDADDELHRLAVTLNDMLDRLDEARRRQRAFVADAAHELRNPLASLRTQLEVAERRVSRGGEPVSAEALADLVADTERLSRLADDLLLLARLDDTGAGRPAGAPVEVSALVREVAGRYAAARVPVVVAAPRRLWVAGRADELRRVLANLLDNAVRHAATEVRVDASVEDRAVVVVVRDDGAGIAPADRDRVFERFTRLDDARGRDEGGAGLGLGIVRELVRGHGGTVRLADAEPGLRVEVRLPRSHAKSPV